MLSKALRYLIIFLLAIVLLAGGWVWLTLTWSYSQGERAGYVQKLSQKGWLCKTWEGEIAMVTMPGAIPDKFEFTVRNESVADKINQLAGKRVVLVYKQHKFIPSSCFGETEYFIEDVREVVDGLPIFAPGALAPVAPSPAQPSPTLPKQ
jgi:hypothetical protein